VIQHTLIFPDKSQPSLFQLPARGVTVESNCVKILCAESKWVRWTKQAAIVRMVLELEFQMVLSMNLWTMLRVEVWKPRPIALMKIQEAGLSVHLQMTLPNAQWVEPGKVGTSPFPEVEPRKDYPYKCPVVEPRSGVGHISGAATEGHCCCSSRPRDRGAVFSSSTNRISLTTETGCDGFSDPRSSGRASMSGSNSGQG
jgi:hypothetical protein